MKNHARAIADILIHEGLISAKDIVDGDFQVTDISRRNQNYRVEFGDGNGFLIKQVKSSDPQAAASFQCEAAVHWLAQNDPDFAPFNGLSPRCRGYDPQRNLLVINLIGEARTLSEALVKGLDNQQAARTGQLLAIAHWQTGRKMLEGNLESPFKRRIPWTLTIQTLPAEHLSTVSEGNRQLIVMVQTTPALRDMLTAVHSAWRPQAFIHGDLKPDNCLVLNSVEKHERYVQFVDWELADFGDPAWDLAALLQGFWTPSLLQHGHVDATFSFMHSVWPLIDTLMQSYLSNSAIPADQWSAMRCRSIQFAGARMVQTAYEMLHSSAVVTPEATLVLQAAIAIYANAQLIESMTGVGL